MSLPTLHRVWWEDEEHWRWAGLPFLCPRTAVHPVLLVKCPHDTGPRLSIPPSPSHHRKEM